MKMSPLAALFAIMIVGVTIATVERQSKQAAYALLILVLLGIVTFNAARFGAELNLIMFSLSKPTVRSGSRPKSKKAGTGR